jgi:hypothetical protein
MINEADAARYAVVFKGRIEEGRNLDAVKRNVAKLLKKPPDDVAGLFNGGPHVIKRDADLETAEKIVRAFRQAGAICESRKLADPEVKDAPAAPETAESEAGKVCSLAETCIEKGDFDNATRHLQRAKALGSEKAGRLLAWGESLKAAGSGEQDKETGILILVFIVSFFLAGHVPDLDLETSLLNHRSIVTHNFFIPLALFVVAWIRNSERFRMAAVGSGIAIGVHLAFDLFPKGWQGFALIHAPTAGALSKEFSIVWGVATVFFCLFLAFKAIKRILAALLSAPAMLGGYFYAAESEAHLMFKAGFALLVIGGVAAWLARFNSGKTQTPPVR